ncbi:MAG: hypothetical protein ACRD9Q_03655, partial [Nitrososphaeraceae archaeon]
MDDIHEIKRVTKTYDDRAKKYDSIGAAGQWGSGDMVSLICDEIFNKVKITKKDKVLEIGCGSGVLGNVIKNK